MREKLLDNKLTKSISSTRIFKPVIIDVMLKSPKTNTLGSGLFHRLPSILDEVASKTK